jgi:hypothetical protein
LARLKQKIIIDAWTFRHDRALSFLSHRQGNSLGERDDDSISFADFYDDYRYFSFKGKSKIRAMVVLRDGFCRRFIYRTIRHAHYIGVSNYRSCVGILFGCGL